MWLEGDRALTWLRIFTALGFADVWRWGFGFIAAPLRFGPLSVWGISVGIRVSLGPYVSEILWAQGLHCLLSTEMASYCSELLKHGRRPT